MTVSTSMEKGSFLAWRLPGWLTLAASPSFAVMAWVSAQAASPMMMCPAGSGILPLGDMSRMYLLMCLFHLSPWLRLASGGLSVAAPPITEGD
jgi:hypothetical protein